MSVMFRPWPSKCEHCTQYQETLKLGSDKTIVTKQTGKSRNIKVYDGNEAKDGYCSSSSGMPIGS